MVWFALVDVWNSMEILILVAVRRALRGPEDPETAVRPGILYRNRPAAFPVSLRVLALCRQ